MKRRDFIWLLGGAAAWPLSARAQQTGRLPTIGFLGAATAAVMAPWTAAFEKRLHELGWTTGRTVVIEYRWAEGRSIRFVEIATEFVRFNVDVIVTAGTEPVIATKQVTSVVPIVFALAVDPVAAGLVASLARPGGNITGLSLQSSVEMVYLPCIYIVGSQWYANRIGCRGWNGTAKNHAVLHAYGPGGERGRREGCQR